MVSSLQNAPVSHGNVSLYIYISKFFGLFLLWMCCMLALQVIYLWATVWQYHCNTQTFRYVLGLGARLALVH